MSSNFASLEATHAGGADWAHAAEVFRKHDADGSGFLDRAELLAALRECQLLTACSATAAGRALADMDTNGDGRVSFEEFREAYSRLVKLRAAEQRQARLLSGRKAAPAVPANAGVDPRLRAAFQHFASYGAARGLAERAARNTGPEGMASRQFQRACAAAAVPLETGVLDVVFSAHCAGRGRTLSFLEALAQVAYESSLSLELVLDAMRAAAPAGAPAEPPSAGASAAISPTKSAGTKSPRPASPRPKSAGGCYKPPRSPPPPVPGQEVDEAGGAPVLGPAGAVLSTQLKQRVVTLQQLLEEGLGEEEGGAIPAHPTGGTLPGAVAPSQASPGRQGQQAGVGSLQLNPAFQTQQGQETSDHPSLPAFRAEMLSLLDQRCEAAERTCAALVATRAELTRALAAQCTAAVGGAGGAGQAAEALEAVQGLECRLAALDERLSGAVRQVGQECRAAVSVVQAQVESLQRSHDQAIRQTNEAILCIARRVGSLGGVGPGAGQKQAQVQGS